MNDEIRKKHAEDMCVFSEQEQKIEYSQLSISEVDSLFRALDAERGKVEKVREEIAHAISGGYGILPEELEEILK